LSYQDIAPLLEMRWGCETTVHKVQSTKTPPGRWTTRDCTQARHAGEGSGCWYGDIADRHAFAGTVLRNSRGATAEGDSRRRELGAVRRVAPITRNRRRDELPLGSLISRFWCNCRCETRR